MGWTLLSDYRCIINITNKTWSGGEEEEEVIFSASNRLDSPISTIKEPFYDTSFDPLQDWPGIIPKYSLACRELLGVLYQIPPTRGFNSRIAKNGKRITISMKFALVRGSNLTW